MEARDTMSQTTAADSTHAGGAEAAAPQNTNVFWRLLDAKSPETALGDHHSLQFKPFAEVPLPYFFWDQDGFHSFSGEKAVEESGTYEVNATGKASRKDGKSIGLDMSITSNVFFLSLAAVILFIVLRISAAKAKKSLVPSGIRNVVEVLMVFVRDDIIQPNLPEPYATSLLPYFLTVFFFIMTVNLVGLLPWGHTATGSINVTVALALCTFVITQIVGIRAMGVKAFFKHLLAGVPEMELAVGMKIFLILIMFVIEVVGLFTKPVALAIRLFANMTAGHIIIVSLIGLTFLFHSLVVGAFVTVPFALFVFLLEIFVATLQAYIFTTLSAVFIGMMAHTEHEAHVEDHDMPHAPNGDHLIATNHAV